MTNTVPKNSGVDPIFAAIELHSMISKQWRSHDADADKKRDAELCAQDREALRALLTTAPTTLAGCAALLRHVADYGKQFDCSLFHDWTDDTATAGAVFMPTLAAAIDRIAATGGGAVPS